MAKELDTGLQNFMVLSDRYKLIAKTYTETLDFKQTAAKADITVRQVQNILKKPKVMAAIDYLKKLKVQKDPWTHLDLLSFMREIIHICMGKEPVPNSEDKYIFKPRDALAAIRQYGEYYGMWRDNFDSTPPGGDPVSKNPIKETTRAVEQLIDGIFNRDTRITVRNQEIVFEAGKNTEKPEEKHLEVEEGETIDINEED